MRRQSKGLGSTGPAFALRGYGPAGKMLGKKRSETALLKALEQEFEKDAVRFFKTIVMPLLPKESKLNVDRDGVIEWKSLVGGDDSAVPGGE